MSNVTTGSLSHIGGRDENQDAVWCRTDAGTGCVLAVVADGMGGHQDGAVAARMAIDAAESLWQRRAELGGQRLLESLVAEAHAAIRAAAFARGVDMRTVLAALWIGPGEAVSIHAGDCRVIQFSGAGAVKASIDHSVAQLRVLQGKLDPALAAQHPSQSRLITSVGGPELPEHELTTWDLAAGRQFIVCSDGFWSLVTPGDQQSILAARDLESALGDAVRTALDSAAPDHDNLSAIAIRVEGPWPASRAPRRRWVPAIALVTLLASLGAALALWLRPAAPAPPARNEASESVPPRPSGESGEQAVQGRGQESGFGRQGSEAGAAQSAPSSEGVPSADGGPATAGDDREAEGVAPDEATRVDATGLALPTAGSRSAAQALTEWLRARGQLPATDELVDLPFPPKAAAPEYVYLVQRHDGLPVDGAELTGMIRGGKVVSVQGQVQSVGRIQPGEPMDYPLAVRKAAAEKRVEVEVSGQEGQWLVRLPDGAYARAWRVKLRVGPGRQPETWVVDAVSGKLLRQIPGVMER